MSGKPSAGTGKVIVSCAVTGSIHVPSMTPHLPITPGQIAESAIGGAALTGTAIGAAAGGLGSLLTKHGVSEDDARYYEDRVNNGGVFVSVDNSASIDAARVSDILHSAGGHSASRARSGATL